MGTVFGMVKIVPNDAVNVFRICGMKGHDLMIRYSISFEVCLHCVKLLLQVLVDHIIYVINGPFCGRSAYTTIGITLAPEVGGGNHEVHPLGVAWPIGAVGFESDLFKSLSRVYSSGACTNVCTDTCAELSNVSEMVGKR